MGVLLGRTGSGPPSRHRLSVARSPVLPNTALVKQRSNCSGQTTTPVFLSLVPLSSPKHPRARGQRGSVLNTLIRNKKRESGVGGVSALTPLPRSDPSTPRDGKGGRSQSGVGWGGCLRGVGGSENGVGSKGGGGHTFGPSLPCPPPSPPLTSLAFLSRLPLSPSSLTFLCLGFRV